ncbi:unannotated protein [freshwater metagenome]|uniref:Unannotated protein n=1 Tax=freshwater metagenome TaxID=449393 RepID=A0A6J6YC27_9ZZZZ
MHRNVCDLHLVFFDALCFHTIVDHDVAERAGNRDLCCTGSQQFLRALDVDLFAGAFFHPHATAAGATAHALGAVATGFNDFNAAE